MITKLKILLTCVVFSNFCSIQTKKEVNLSVLNEEVWEIQMGQKVGDTRLGAVADIRLPVTATKQNIGYKTPTRHQQNIGHKTPVQLFLKLSDIRHHHHQHTIRCKPGPQLLPQKHCVHHQFSYTPRQPFNQPISSSNPHDYIHAALWCGFSQKI